MTNFRSSMEKFITCEVTLHGKVKYFAKLSDNNWVAVISNGNLDWVEVSPSDFNDMLKSVETVGATVRFTNHSAV